MLRREVRGAETHTGVSTVETLFPSHETGRDHMVLGGRWRGGQGEGAAGGGADSAAREKQGCGPGGQGPRG